MGKFGYFNKVYLGMLAGIMVVMMFCSNVGATAVSVFDNTWTEFTSIGANGSGEDGDNPYGGQSYDHEHFFYQVNNSQLSIGMQSGFNLGTGTSGSYYLGDMGLSFDGTVDLTNGTGFEYGFDFGLETQNASGTDVDFGSGTGVDTAGLYSVAAWDNDTSNASHDDETVAPFAIDDINGARVAEASGNSSGQEGQSYYRIVEFEITDLLALYNGSLTVDTHLTMSCGNDVMNGRFIVGGPQQAPAIPEPSTIALLGIGLVGLAGGAARRRMKKKNEEK